MKREWEYPASRPGDCQFDTANPAFFIRDYTKHGQSLRADYAMKDKETGEQYWVRVRDEIGRKTSI